MHCNELLKSLSISLILKAPTFTLLWINVAWFEFWRRLRSFWLSTVFGVTPCAQVRRRGSVLLRNAAHCPAVSAPLSHPDYKPVSLSLTINRSSVSSPEQSVTDGWLVRELREEAAGCLLMVTARCVPPFTCSGEHHSRDVTWSWSPGWTRGHVSVSPRALYCKHERLDRAQLEIITCKSLSTLDP